MLGQVVGAVKLPQKGHVVHGAVVDVEPEVENDAVEARLEVQLGPPLPVAHDVERRLRRGVAEPDHHGEARTDGLVYGPDDFSGAVVGDAIAVVGVAVEEAVLVAETTQDVDFLDDDGVEENHVEVEGGVLADIPARQRHKCLVQDQGHQAIEQDPDMLRDLSQVWHFIGLWVLGNGLVQRNGMDAEEVDGLLVHVPCAAVVEAPCRLHRVFVANCCRSRSRLGLRCCHGCSGFGSCVCLCGLCCNSSLLRL